MQPIFINKEIAPKANWRTISLNVLLNSGIPLLLFIPITYLLEGDMEFSYMLCTVFIVLSTTKMFFSKELASIYIDNDRKAVILNRKNSFEIISTKTFKLDETDLTPIIQSKKRVEFDLSNKNNYVTISSKTKGISKSDILTIYSILKNELGFKVITMK